MRQIGGENSTLYSLTAAELAAFDAGVAAGQLLPPASVHPEGPTGALVRFASLDEVALVRLYLP
ncbi:hypothetical protein FHS31_002974 [Sphingomonas vulcanisoli]|uniref:Uncharacterized protein n=1 Tax=Sphingomonas vulcanisoli TaxID=1658060 RepID=A0ABX0TXZ0_9SPHN|nr:hypothetical protein [Sphingomonas vulcanisoli]NIJ09342.1 hypothetical protein [Sphingomonas vulcanisoli]